MLSTSKVKIRVKEGKALLDTGTGRSLLAPSLAEELGEKSGILEQLTRFKTAAGRRVSVTQIIVRLQIQLADFETAHDFLVRLILYRLILGAELMYRQWVPWHFPERTLCVVQERME